MQLALPLDCWWVLIRIRGNLVTIITFIRVQKVILKSVFSKVLNIFLIYWRLFLQPDGDSGLFKMSFMIWSLSPSGNQYWLTARFWGFKSKFLIGSSLGNLWITWFKYQSMLLNQRGAYERGGSLLYLNFLTKESLRVSVVLNCLRRIHLIDSVRLLN